MMEIYILRHATAVERGIPNYQNDGDRPLTAAGRQHMHAAARSMLGLGLQFDLILSSPYRRAAETAHIVAGALGGRVTCTDFLQPDGNIHNLIRQINERHPGCVLLVGHEPDLSRMISVLVTGGCDAAIELKKGGLCKLTAEKLGFGRCATLRWLLTPKQLRAMR
jgi:phosphohistidine phosphatase